MKMTKDEVEKVRSGVFADYKIFAGNSTSQHLLRRLQAIMGKPLGKSTVTKFSDGEISVNIWETVRGLRRVHNSIHMQPGKR